MRRFLLPVLFFALCIAALHSCSAYAQTPPTVAIGGPIGVAGGLSTHGAYNLNVGNISCPYTLTANEWWQGQLVFTGALSADCTITLPANAGQSPDVFNLTTGGHNIIIQPGNVALTPGTGKGQHLQYVAPAGVYVAVGGGSSITLRTNGTDNPSQSMLNLRAGANVTVSPATDGSGDVTIGAAGGGTAVTNTQLNTDSGLGVMKFLGQSITSGYTLCNNGYNCPGAYPLQLGALLQWTIYDDGYPGDDVSDQLGRQSPVQPFTWAESITTSTVTGVDLGANDLQTDLPVVGATCASGVKCGSNQGIDQFIRGAETIFLWQGVPDGQKTTAQSTASVACMENGAAYSGLAVVQSGTWTTATWPNNAFGLQTSAAGSLTFHCIWGRNVKAVIGREYGNTSTFTLAIDGTSVYDPLNQTSALSAQMLIPGHNGSQYTMQAWGQNALPYAAHSITITATPASGKNVRVYFAAGFGGGSTNAAGPKVYAATQPYDCYTSTFYPNWTDVATNQYNQALISKVGELAADGMNIHTVDAGNRASYNACTQSSGDGVHPSTAGASSIANVWYSAMTVAATAADKERTKIPNVSTANGNFFVGGKPNLGVGTAAASTVSGAVGSATGPDSGRFSLGLNGYAIHKDEGSIYTDIPALRIRSNITSNGTNPIVEIGNTNDSDYAQFSMASTGGQRYSIGIANTGSNLNGMADKLFLYNNTTGAPMAAWDMTGKVHFGPPCTAGTYPTTFSGLVELGCGLSIDSAGVLYGSSSGVTINGPLTVTNNVGSNIAITGMYTPNMGLNQYTLARVGLNSGKYNSGFMGFVNMGGDQSQASDASAVSNYFTLSLFGSRGVSVCANGGLVINHNIGDACSSTSTLR